MVQKQYHKCYFASTKWQNKLTKIAQNNHARPGPDSVTVRLDQGTSQLPEAAQKHVSDFIKVLYKLTLQSIYGTKIAQNGTRNSTKQSPARPRLAMDSVMIMTSIITQNAHPRRKRFGRMPLAVLITGSISRTGGDLPFVK